METNHVRLTEPWSFSARESEILGSNFREKSELTTSNEPRQATTQPYVTGSSVIALRFCDGVMMAADNLASYGSMARFRDIERLMQVGPSTVITVGGDISDYQHLQQNLNNLLISESYHNDGHHLEAQHIASYLAYALYKKRCDFDPLWNTVVIAGPNHLSYADLYGTTYESDSIATGLGGYLAAPLLRKHTEDGKWRHLSKESARQIIDEVMRVLFYRDGRSLNKFSVACISSQDIEIAQYQSVETEWKFAERNYGYGTQTV